MRNGTKAAKAGAVELNGKTVMLKWSAVSSGEPPRGILFGQIFMQDKLCSKLRIEHHCPLSRCSTLQELKAQFRLSAAAVSQFWVASMSHSLDGRTVASAKMSTQPNQTTRHKTDRPAAPTCRSQTEIVDCGDEVASH